MSFLNASLDWFLGKRAGHMGPDQYVAHAGMRNGKPTSGALLWAESEAKTVSSTGNMVNAETSLLHKVGGDIENFVSLGTAIVELGPGTTVAFRNKTLPIARRLQSEVCILVDESVAFLKQIATANNFPDLEIRPIIDDFFATESAYWGEEALVCSFGSTISNFVGPVSQELPQAVLVDGLSKMALAANSGWMLVAFDSDHDEQRIKSFYKGQALFQLNIFDRMAVELPLERGFDPNLFEYEPQWIVTSGQLAHMAVVREKMNFKLDGVAISLKQGQKLHIKNSYKFAPRFFERCCEMAGLEIIESWSDDSPAKIYLLKILPKRAVVQLPKPDKAA